jgi:hypothetical protein
LSDFIDDLLQPNGANKTEPAVRGSEARRRVIEQLVEVLTQTADASLSMTSEHHHQTIVRLTGMIKDMTAQIAEADEASFSAIVQEAAMLVRTLQHRGEALRQFTMH